MQKPVRLVSDYPGTGQVAILFLIILIYILNFSTCWLPLTLTDSGSHAKEELEGGELGFLLKS